MAVIYQGKKMNPNTKKVRKVGLQRIAAAYKINWVEISTNRAPLKYTRVLIIICERSNFEKECQVNLCTSDFVPYLIGLNSL